MAGAVLKFSGGHLGFERCQDGNGAQYIRAVIASTTHGRTQSAPVDSDDVIRFARDALMQAALAKGLDIDKLVIMALEQMVDEIRAEQR